MVLATKCVDQCTHEEVLVCGTDGVVYQNECLLKYAACQKSIDIQVDNKLGGSCDPDNQGIKEGERKDEKRSDAFDTTGDDDDENDNYQENEKILRDDGKDKASLDVVFGYIKIIEF